MIELLVPPARLSGLLPQFIGAADNFDSKRPSHCRGFRIPEHSSTQKSAFRIRQLHLHQCQLGSTVPDNKFVQSRPPHKLFRIELLISSSAAPEFALPPGEAPSSGPRRRGFSVRSERSPPAPNGSCPAFLEGSTGRATYCFARGRSADGHPFIASTAIREKFPACYYWLRPPCRRPRG
jgi:hypothetical protein